MELAARVGPSLDHWLEAPFALALWTYCELQELDRRDQWVRRMERLEEAELMHLAFNEPRRLNDERAKIVASAAGKTPAMAIEQLRERGERMARFIRKGQVLVS